MTVIIEINLMKCLSGHICTTSKMCTYRDSEGKGDSTTTIIFWLFVDGAIDLIVEIKSIILKRHTVKD
jgi:hypothetical protein